MSMMDFNKNHNWYSGLLLTIIAKIVSFVLNSNFYLKNLCGGLFTNSQIRELCHFKTLFLHLYALTLMIRHWFL